MPALDVRRSAPRAICLASFVAATALAALRAAPVEACSNYNETFHGEAYAMPCVLDAILGAFPTHTETYHETRITAADVALAWAPGWTEPLDTRAIALIWLRRLDQARDTLEQRAAVEPDAYETHANLGTLYTFTGELDAALEHIDRALELQPDAHFGREIYHRHLVDYLARAAADPASVDPFGFLELRLDKKERFDGMKRRWVARELDDDAIDAVVAMIAVYGAEGVPILYSTLGDLLALRGHRRLAWAAYTRAAHLGHPEADRLHAFARNLAEAIGPETIADSKAGPSHPSRELVHDKLSSRLRTNRAEADAHREAWHQRELELIEQGLPIWREAGLTELYEEMDRHNPRCSAPGLIDSAASSDDALDVSDGEAPAPEATR